MGLVLDVNADDARHARIALGHKAQVADPLLLAVAGGVPKLADGLAIGSVVVQQHIHAARAQLVDHLVHDLDGREALQICIAAVVDVAGRGRAVQRGGAERQAHGIEALCLHLRDHVLPVAGPQAMHHMRVGFKTKPVHAAQLNRLPCIVDHFARLDSVAPGGAAAYQQAAGQSEVFAQGCQLHCVSLLSTGQR